MEQGEKSGADRVDIRGDKLELHTQDIVRKMEVARRNIYVTPKFLRA